VRRSQRRAGPGEGASEGGGRRRRGRRRAELGPPAAAGPLAAGAGPRGARASRGVAPPLSCTASGAATRARSPQQGGKRWQPGGGAPASSAIPAQQCGQPPAYARANHVALALGGPCEATCFYTARETEAPGGVEPRLKLQRASVARRESSRVLSFPIQAARLEREGEIHRSASEKSGKAPQSRWPSYVFFERCIDNILLNLSNPCLPAPPNNLPREWGNNWLDSYQTPQVHWPPGSWDEIFS
jgi:hypothetical protein